MNTPADNYAAPPFKSYFPSMEEMSNEQKDFYLYWRNCLSQGNYPDLEGNISYAFTHIYDLIASQNMEIIIRSLVEIAAVYSHEEKLSRACRRWISDCFVCTGDIPSALKEFPTLVPESRSSSQTDSLLSLKFALGTDLNGRDVFTLFGPKVTKYGREHLDEVVTYADSILDSKRQNEGCNFLLNWAPKTYTVKQGYSVFAGTASQRDVPSVKSYCFSLNQEVEAFISQLCKDAENTVREERGIPRIGEGWISETRLYYQIKEAFPKFSVIHHARLSWLGRQHLDIFIEGLSVALEYQGLQHDQPVEFFGGEKAFLENQRRDKRKKRLCEENDTHLIYVREGYELEAVIKQIQDIQQAQMDNPTSKSSK